MPRATISKKSNYKPKIRLPSKLPIQAKVSSESESESELESESESESESEENVAPPVQLAESRSRSQKRKVTRSPKFESKQVHYDEPSSSRSASAKRTKALQALGDNKSKREISRHKSSTLQLTILKITGLETVPYKHAEFVTILATYEGNHGNTQQTAQFDRRDLDLTQYATFTWRLTNAERINIGKNHSSRSKLVELEVKIEKESSGTKRKWTHLVGTAFVPEPKAKQSGQVLHIDLDPNVMEHGIQQIEYTVEIK